jgi:UDP-glucose 4-epimerase
LVRALVARGDAVVVVDNLRQGHRAAVAPGAELIEADIADRRRLAEVFAAWRFDAVFHFAALSLVGESMREPLRYCAENAGNSLWLAEAAVRAGVTKFVFSSTAALFGNPREVPIPEGAVLAPASAYGESKLMVERGLFWADQVHGLRSACLRYFNAAGADPSGAIGEDHEPETHLIPLAIGAALGTRPALTVFGTDYPTPDGTCLRDYVHVDDLSRAHIAVFEALEQPSIGLFYNLGTGTPTSVRAVIAAVEKITGRRVPVVESPRRAGDPPALYADASKARAELDWQVQYPEIDSIVASAWRWHKDHPDGYADR